MTEPEVVHILTPRERELLNPLLQQIHTLTQQRDGLVEHLTRAVRLKAGRDDVRLDLASGAIVTVPTAAPAP